MNEDNVIQLFKDKNLEPLSTKELLEFKRILEISLDSFQSLGVMEKYGLYNETVNLVFLLLELVHPELKEFK